MGIDYTTLDLIAKVKRRILAPSAQSLFQPADIVAFLDEEMRNEIVPLVMSYRQEHFVHDEDTVAVSGQRSFGIPQRAIGAKLRDVVLVNSAGDETLVPRLEPDILKRQNSLLTTRQAGWYFKDDQVVFNPNSLSLQGQTVRLKYFRRPNILLQRSQAGQVTIVNTGTNEVTVGAAPTTWAVSTTFDVISGTPPVFRSRQDDVAITGISGSVLTFSTLPSGIAVGDWIAEAGFSPIPQVPFETFNLLVQRAVIRICEGLKDSVGKKLALESYEEMLGRFTALVNPRSDGTPQKISSVGGIMDYSGSGRGIW